MTEPSCFPRSVEIRTSSNDRFPEGGRLEIVQTGTKARVALTRGKGEPEIFDDCPVAGGLITREFEEEGKRKLFVLSLCEIDGRAPFVCGALFEPRGRREDTATGGWVAEEGGRDEP